MVLIGKVEVFNTYKAVRLNPHSFGVIDSTTVNLRLKQNPSTTVVCVHSSCGHNVMFKCVYIAECRVPMTDGCLMMQCHVISSLSWQGCTVWRNNKMNGSGRPFLRYKQCYSPFISFIAWQICVASPLDSRDLLAYRQSKVAYSSS